VRALAGQIAHVTTRERSRLDYLGKVCRVGRQQFRKEPGVRDTLGEIGCTGK